MITAGALSGFINYGTRISSLFNLHIKKKEHSTFDGI